MTRHRVKVLELRRTKLNNYLTQERNKAKRLLGKSPHVRRTSPLYPRIGLIRDHLNELDLIIGYLKGDTNKKRLMEYQIDDDVANFFASDF